MVKYVVRKIVNRISFPMLLRALPHNRRKYTNGKSTLYNFVASHLLVAYQRLTLLVLLVLFAGVHRFSSKMC